MNEPPSSPQRSEIWLVRFDPTVGSELQKTRPAVVVNEDSIGRINMRIVVPITSWKPDFEFYPWMIRFPVTRRNGLAKSSGADASQVKAVSVKRFEKKLGIVTRSELEEIVAGIVLCIGYESPDPESAEVS